MFTWSRRSNQDLRGRKRGIRCSQKLNAIHQATRARQTDHPYSWQRQWGRGVCGAHKLIPMSPVIWRAPIYRPQESEGYHPRLSGPFPNA